MLSNHATLVCQVFTLTTGKIALSSVTSCMNVKYTKNKSKMVKSTISRRVNGKFIQSYS